MKRKDILKKLREAGRTFEEGGNHTKVYKDGVFQAIVGRHNEIDEKIVEKIEKQTGVKLR
ncbi:type II toxin-antitoxin system HicA family toxin [uncultured Desulfovibrio sp.]|uniref:type II toxin-antitoxin system HicA family toxin n=1 Tax=uncultured Desulfovibrio sp. TaxID=167968 RepID=UPI002601A5C7|nr:type II toxin-antitoxin system HicA family toxin [uncultured Desulfovibrio sp.]